MSVKLLEYILIGTNECVEVESPAIFDNQETLLYSHCYQRGGLPLMNASSKALTWKIPIQLENSKDEQLR